MSKIISILFGLLLAGRLVAQPVITLQPTNQVVLNGSGVYLAVAVAYTTSPLTFQWQFNGTNLPNLVTTVAGKGTIGFSGDGGAATNAVLSAVGLVTDNNGNLFFADSYNNRIRKIDTNGIVTTVAGTNTSGFAGDGGTAVVAKLNNPTSVALDAAGNLYVADANNSRIREIGTNGIIHTVAGSSSTAYSGDGGPATTAGLNDPVHVAVDASGNLWIADEYHYRIREVTTNGIINTVAGTNVTGFAGDGGPATSAKFSNPASVAANPMGGIFIADTGNNRIREIITNGFISTVAGTNTISFTGDGGPATGAGLSSPADVAADTTGNLFVADYNHFRIRRVDVNGVITTVAGNGTGTYSGDNGAATNAGMYVNAVTADPYGNLFIADSGRIRKVTLNDTPVLWLNNAGTNNTGNYSVVITSASGSVTSSVVSVTVVLPPGIAVQPQGELVTNGAPAAFGAAVTGTPPLAFQWQKNGVNLTDGGDLSGSATTNLNFSGASPGDAGAYTLIVANAYGSVTSSVVALTVVVPPGITSPPANQVVLNGGNATFSVGVSGTGPFAYQWQLNGTNLPANRIITTVAGNGTGGFAGDGGPATNALLASPYAVAVDGSGNLFIADYGNSRVRKVDTNGVITTVAGTGSFTSSGDGSPAISAGFDYVTAVAVDAGNNLYIADEDTGRIRKVGTNGIITTVAGSNLGLSGDGNAATNAQLSYLAGVAVDAVGNLFIADQGNSRVRKVNASGIISTLASSVGACGVAVDSADNVYVGSGTMSVYKVNASGTVTTVAGNGGYGSGGDGGPATSASLNDPKGEAVDVFGNVFIADYGNNRIRQVNSAGIISTVAGRGGNNYYGDGGLATNAYIRQPIGVAVDAAGNVFFADQGNNRIRKINLAGSPVLTLQNVTPTGALLSASLPTNSVYVGMNGAGAATAGNISVIVTSPYGSVTSSVAPLSVVFPPTITAQPASVTVGNDGPASFTVTAGGTAPFGYQWYFNNATLPAGTGNSLVLGPVDASRTGNYFCVITNNYGSITSRVATLAIGLPPVIAIPPVSQTGLGGGNVALGLTVSGTGPFAYQWQCNGTNLPNNVITTVAGNGTNGFSGDGSPATNASLGSPSFAAVDGQGRLLISATGSFRVRRVDDLGVITTAAGSGSTYYSGDGLLATKNGLVRPTGLTADPYGNWFVADAYDNCIRKVDANVIITTAAGNGVASGPGYFAGDGGPATNAALYYPSGLAADAVGNLFLADTENNRVRKVDPSGNITTVAGKGPSYPLGSYSGDGGPATNANLNYPNGVAVDAAGEVFIADQGNNLIRKVDAFGIITTVAGNLTNGYTGDGGPATNASLSGPRDVKVDAVGNLYIADYGNHRIRRVDTNGLITTVAGNGTNAFAGDGGVATNASLAAPTGVALDAAGNLFIVDSPSYRVREVGLAGSPQLVLNNLSLSQAGNYQVMVSSPYGSVTSPVVSVTVLVPPQNFSANVETGSGLQLHFNGTPNHAYVLESTTNLAPPVNWQPVVTNATDAAGNWSFTDTNGIQLPQLYYQALP